ncbi:hypothetical protein Klosneuvirus_1_296 [Klosneuvirus KNV1]|uniref:Uncharacterized protein n=1 Tax=Klosneuvirus KNV1 TaxID=1977640 RepID=A0A1V0SI93_9VIRU|nr:hypothetical protein Klosneuvirus_1_296 [Klosneuvirus KNV1]
MNDMNRVLIFLLLIGLLYALYKYQHIIFGNTIYSFESKSQPIKHQEPPRIKHYEQPRESKPITADNISQVSIASLENDDGGDNDHELYKNDSLLGSLDTGSLNLTENGSINSSFFFK